MMVRLYWSCASRASIVAIPSPSRNRGRPRQAARRGNCARRPLPDASAESTRRICGPYPSFAEIMSYEATPLESVLR